MQSIQLRFSVFHAQIRKGRTFVQRAIAHFGMIETPPAKDERIWLAETCFTVEAVGSVDITDRRRIAEEKRLM